MKFSCPPEDSVLNTSRWLSAGDRRKCNHSDGMEIISLFLGCSILQTLPFSRSNIYSEEIKIEEKYAGLATKANLFYAL